MKIDEISCEPFRNQKPVSEVNEAVNMNGEVSFGAPQGLLIKPSLI